MTTVIFLSIMIFGFWGLVLLSKSLTKLSNNPKPVKKSEYEKKKIKATIDDVERRIRGELERGGEYAIYRLGYMCPDYIVLAVCNYLNDRGFIHSIDIDNELYIQLIKRDK